jgi:acyl-CoA thioester hydrolase
MTSSLADYPVVVEIPVAWGEMDAYGHVNNIVYFRYFELKQRISELENAKPVEVNDRPRSGRAGIAEQTRP